MIMKKKILIVMMNLYNGGAEKSLVNLLGVIDYNIYDIDLLLFQKKGMFLNQIPDKVNILETPDDLHYLYNMNAKIGQCLFSHILLFTVQLLGKLFMLLNRYDSKRKKRQLRWKYIYKKHISCLPQKYDIALGYIEGEPSYYVIDKVTAIKKYIWVHNDYSKTGLDKNLDYPYFICADKIVTISNKCVDILKKEFPDVKQKVVLLPNISSKKYLVERAKQNFDIEFRPQTFKVLSIGRLTEQKGFDMAIEAASILKEKHVDYQWIIIGEGKQLHKLQSMIKRYGLDYYVLLVGAKENPYPYMQEADILVQSSRYEGKSVVLDEAKMLGLPVVATNYPTVWDQVSDDWGYVTEMNAVSIAEQLFYLYEHQNEILNKSEYLDSLSFDITNQLELYYNLLKE